MTKKLNCLFLVMALTSPFVLAQDKSLVDDVHAIQSTEHIKQLKQLYVNNSDLNDYWEVEENIPELNDESQLTTENCADVLKRAHKGLNHHFLSLSLHKLALTCHHILKQDELAQSHENNLIALASIITQSGDGKTLDQALWVTDLTSAYVFLQLADYSLIDAQLNIEDDKVYLITYIRDKKTFGEYKAFDVTDYFKKMKKVFDQDDSEWESSINIILTSKLKNNLSVIALAAGGMSEAQILLADILMENVREFKGLYPSVLGLYEMAAENGSAIAQHRYAQRVFVDQLEDRYTKAHSYLTDAIEQRFYRAFVLAIIIREKQLGIETDESTIQDLLTLASMESENPGALEYQIAQSYENKKQWNDSKLAHKYYLKSAEQGYHWGTVNVGDDYRFGFGIKKNEKESFKWYMKATKNRDPENGYLKVAYSYLHGIGVKKDIDQSLIYNNKAADMGSRVGMTNLGLLHYYKKHKRLDHKKAQKWFEKAVELNDEKAMYHLGQMYYFGEVVEQDFQKAKTYFEQAVDSEYYEPTLFLGVMAEKGLGMDKDKALALKYYNKSLKIAKNTFAELNIDLIDTPNHEPLTNHESYLEELELKAKQKDPIALYQLAQFENISFFSNNYDGKKLLEKSAKLGFSKAYLQMAKKYLLLGYSLNRAIKYYKKSYEMGNADAASILAQVHLREEKTEEGLKALKYAVSQEHPEATYLLGNLYEVGSVVEKDLNQAIKLYKKALSLNFNLAAYRLVPLYLSTETSDSDVNDAIIVLKKLVEKSDDKIAKRNLGEIYANPNFKDFNMDQASEWLIQASEKGDGYASLLIAKAYFDGQHLQKNDNNAKFFFNDSLYKKEYRASFWLGLMYERGYGSDIDYESAKAFYQNSKNTQRKKEALNNLSVLTCQKHISAAKGFKPYTTLESLAQKSKTVLFNLAWSNEHGTCRRKNSKNAKKYYQQAADKGSAHALYRLYQLYDQGILFEKNPQKAQEYLTLAKKAAQKIKPPALMTTFMALPLDQLIDQDQTKNNSSEL